VLGSVFTLSVFPHVFNFNFFFNAGVRVMTGAIGRAMPEIGDVTLLLVFLLSMYACVGQLAFQGKFQNKCFSLQSGALINSQACATADSFWGLGGFKCQNNEICADAGFTSDPLNFDSFGEALLTVIMCISGEGWSTVMYQSWDTMHRWTTVYFASLVIFVSIFAIQLVVAILSSKFQASKDEAQIDEDRTSRECSRHHP
jgi:voltage-dependent calcium channel R type alpha-1E